MNSNFDRLIKIYNNPNFNQNINLFINKFYKIFKFHLNIISMMDYLLFLVKNIVINLKIS